MSRLSARLRVLKMNATVYALVASDFPGVFRYIGVTVQPLARRLLAHCYEAGAKYDFGGTRYYGGDRRKAAWIQEVIARGAEVLIVPLVEQLDETESRVTERQLIAEHSPGGQLLNLQSVPPSLT